MSDVVERVARQLFQVYGPSMAVVLTSPAVHGDWVALGAAVASAAVLTTLKWAVRWRAGAGAPLWLALVDRAGSAAAGTLLGLGVTDVFSLLALDWSKAGLAAAGSAGLAVFAYWTVPPAHSPSPAPHGRHTRAAELEDEGTAPGQHRDVRSEP